jgi:ribosomal protein L37AE/L43A
MAAKAGETAQETGDFRCTKCHERTHATKGKKIPKCKNCGGATFDTRENEPGNKSSSKRSKSGPKKSSGKKSGSKKS